MVLPDRPIAEYETVARWLKKLSEGTKHNYGTWLLQFLNRIGSDPDEVVQTRRKALRDFDDKVLEELEDEVREYYKYLVKGKAQGGEGYHPRSAVTAVSSIQSFLSANRAPLGKLSLKAPRGRKKVVSIPSQQELGVMVSCYEGDPVNQWIIIGMAMSGLSIVDFLKLSWDDPQLSSLGTILQQLQERPLGDMVHVHMSRTKTGEPFDTFFGKAACQILSAFPKGERKGPIVNLQERQVRRIVSAAAREAGLRGRCSPHVLREYFTSTLRALGDEAFELSEMWSGHAIGVQDQAYGPAARYRDNVRKQAAKYQELEKYIEPQGPAVVEATTAGIAVTPLFTPSFQSARR